MLCCDDAQIAELNKTYRGKNEPTDVLSFEQPQVDAPAGHARARHARLLGDIVISLETVERYCKGERHRMRNEIRLLFCHGLLHLLGYEHETVAEQDRMAAKQAEYLGVPVDDAWHWIDSGVGAAKPGARRG